MNAQISESDKLAVASAIAESIRTTSPVRLTITNEHPRTQTDEDTILAAFRSYEHYDVTICRENDDTWNVSGVADSQDEFRLRVTVA